jgi:hypothetical protein
MSSLPLIGASSPGLDERNARQNPDALWRQQDFVASSVISRFALLRKRETLGGGYFTEAR